jgi:tripartite ATP-independent transporter DctM subunit
MAESRFLLPLFGLVFIVIGSMYSGYATATEAAAVGVFGALVLSAVQGSLDWNTFKQALMGATKTSAMIAFILMGAAFLSLSMGFTGLPRALAGLIDSYNLSPVALIAVLTLFYLVLGMFMDGLSSVVLTMAIVEPMIRAAGIDVIWFGIFLVVVIETAQVTPPIGFNLFVLQGMTRHEISYIAKTAIPMVGLMLLMVVILVIFPELATWLPDNIRQGASG